jgi:hypothetical protein
MARFSNELVASGTYRPSRIGDLAGDLLATYQRRKATDDPVLSAWQQVVPPGLATHCRIKRFAGSRLEVAVDSPAFLYEMQLCSHELLQAVQGLCTKPRIQSLRFTLG